MRDDLSEVRWGPRVPKRKIQQLYRSEAEGILDEALLDDVGMSFYVRCQSILTVGQAQKGKVRCPRCDESGRETTIRRNSQAKEEVLTCPHCDWHVTWEEYHRTYRGKQLSEGGAGAYLRAFMTRYQAARSPKQRMLAIDRLIHEFHYNTLEGLRKPTRAVGVNLIEGRLTDVVSFLNRLTYGDGTDERIVRTRNKWRSTLDGIDWHPKE